MEKYFLAAPYLVLLACMPQIAAADGDGDEWYVWLGIVLLVLGVVLLVILLVRARKRRVAAAKKAEAAAIEASAAPSTITTVSPPPVLYSGSPAQQGIVFNNGATMSPTPIVYTGNVAPQGTPVKKGPDMWYTPGTYAEGAAPQGTTYKQDEKEPEKNYPTDESVVCLQGQAAVAPPYSPYQSYTPPPNYMFPAAETKEAPIEKY